MMSLLTAQNSIVIEAATQTADETRFKGDTKSALCGLGGIGFTLGTREQSTEQKGQSSSSSASTVGSIGGNVNIVAGNQYTQKGSDVVAPGGDINVLAKNIAITEAQNTRASQTETKFKQSGLTIALTSPVISAIQTGQQMTQAASQTKDSRMQALAGATTALAAKSAYDAVQANPAQAGGINLSISLGGSRSQSKTTQSSSTAQGSTVAAGDNINLTATGAGKDSDLTVQGSRISAGNNLSLKADDAIELLAAQSTASQKSTNSNASGSIGISIGTGGFGVTVSASGGRGKADGFDVTQTNTRVEAGNQLTLDSGDDATLKGAVVAARQVKADVGGNLTIESLQDTSKFASKQASLGASLTIGAGVSGSVSASRSKIDSDYASVTEQSGIKAGDGGFQVNVKGDTDLKGGAIASSDKAIEDGKNTLTTGTLTTSDLQNRAEASAKSSGISLSSDMLTQGKYGAAKGVIGNALNNASESGSSSGQTRSAVSAATVTITDEAKQQQLTGKTSEEVVVSLNRDTANAHSAAQKQDVQAMQRTVEAERAIKAETIKAITTLTDEAYRSRFQQAPKLIKVQCPVASAECAKDTSLLVRTETSREEIAKAPAGSIMAVNGILNDEKRGSELAFQNTEPNKETGEKPSTVYLMHIAPANNTISELLGVAYEKIVASADYGLANFLGYTNGAELQAELLRSRGQEATTSLAHSRATLIQESAFTILANRPDENSNTYTNPNLTVRGVAGASDAESYTVKAAKIINDPKNIDNVTYNYFSNDPVSTSKVSGGNPGVWTLKDLWQVFTTTNSVHSCMGTGAAGCTQVEIPVPGGPQGTPEGNAKLIQFKGGVQVDRDGKPVNSEGQGGAK